MRFTRAVLLPLVAAGAFGLVACSDGVGGTPQAEGGQKSSAAASSSAPESSSAGSSSLSDLDPCSLLRKEEVTRNGPIKSSAPERKTVGTARTCSWDGDLGGTAQLVPTTSVAVRENGGAQDMNDVGYGVDHTTENGRDYARAPSPNGCTIAIGVTQTSRVDIQITSVEETKACEMANELVELAEPRVPKG